MTRWTRFLINQTADAFNAGERQIEIAARLQTTPKAISAALCRARAAGIPVQRRSGTKKKGQVNENL